MKEVFIRLATIEMVEAGDEEDPFAAMLLFAMLLQGGYYYDGAEFASDAASSTGAVIMSSASDAASSAGAVIMSSASSSASAAGTGEAARWKKNRRQRAKAAKEKREDLQALAVAIVADSVRQGLAAMQPDAEPAAKREEGVGPRARL